MDTNRTMKKMGTYIAISLIAGLALLVTGIVLRVLDVQFLENNKALIGMSIIPLALAAYFIVMAALAKRNPKYLRYVAAEQADERITALKQRADSISFRTIRWALVALFLGYTLAYPTEIFETAGWWITFVFFFVSQMQQAVVLTVLMYRDQKNVEGL